MTGYFDKLASWAATTDGRFTVETADNDLARWVTIRRYDGFSVTAHAATYDAAAVSAQQLFKARIRQR